MLLGGHQQPLPAAVSRAAPAAVPRTHPAASPALPAGASGRNMLLQSWTDRSTFTRVAASLAENVSSAAVPPRQGGPADNHFSPSSQVTQPSSLSRG
jgi:hypothetical protein